MTTVKSVILKHQKREDGTWNVKIRITHDRQTAYIPTPYYVSGELISKKTFELKEHNNPTYDQVMLDVIKIRQELVKMGHSVDCYTAKELAALMQDKLAGKPTGVNFFDFAEKHILSLEKEGRRMAQTYKAMLVRLAEYTGGRRNLMFSDITSVFLLNFDKYLRNSQSKNGTGKISSAGVRLYIGKIQHLFNLARLQYNDEDRGIVVISNNPFARYKVPKMAVTRKRALTVGQIRAIRDFSVPFHMRGALIARDVFMLSFLLCGINTVDLYFLKTDSEKDGRIEYQRRKTSGRREDKAFISIRIEPEAMPYISRYRDELGDRYFNFFLRYSSDKQFVTKVNGNLKYIGEKLGIEDLTLYAARHSWATIARNECEVSMDDVAMALNHKSGHDVTDTYIKKDWGRIDNANRKVIDLIFQTKKISL